MAADTGSISERKRELVSLSESQLRSAFQREGLDAGVFDIEEMARCSCQLSAYEIPEKFSHTPHTKQHLYGLRRGFCID